MQIDLAFFDGDTLLVRGTVHFQTQENITTFESKSGHRFVITYCFEEPASPMFVECVFKEEKLYKSEIRFGVSSSDDWETINLGDIHTLAFRRFV